MIAMISDFQVEFNQIGNSLSGPQLRSVPMRHRPLDQEMNKLLFLFQRQSGRPSGGRFGFQCFLPAGLQGITPSHYTTRMATDTSGDLMERQILFQKPNHVTPTLFQQFGRPLRSHRDTPIQDVSLLYCITYA